MDKWKWIQLICTILLALLPIGFEHRNSRYPDRRTNIYHRITRSLFAVWFVACLGLGVVMYQDLSKEVHAPKLLLYGNDTLLTNGSTLLVATTNEYARLKFAVANSGDLPAERVKLSLGVPATFQIGAAKLVNWQSWTEGAFVDRDSPGTPTPLVKGYFLELDTILTPNDYLYYTPMDIVVSSSSLVTSYPIALKIDARQITPTVVHFILVITNSP